MFWKRFFSFITTGVVVVALSGTVLATTKTQYTSAVTGFFKKDAYRPPNDNLVWIDGRQIDFDDIWSGVSNGDVVQVINVPAGTMVLEVGARIVTASTIGGVSMYVGDGSDTDGWLGPPTSIIGAIDLGPSASGVSLTGRSGVTTMFWAADGTGATTFYESVSAAYPADGGKYYSSADTIDVVVVTDDDASNTWADSGGGAPTGVTTVQIQVWGRGYIIPTQ